MTAALYLHIPFCRSKCGYCDFYSVRYDDKLADAYLDALAKEIAELNIGFSSIYVGGGTPSVLNFPLFEKLAGIVKRYSAKAAEITFEMNPDSLDDEKIGLLIDNGINRISVGAQSLSDDKLKKLGRPHDSRQVRETLDVLCKHGLTNVGIDLMFGVCGEGIKDWEKELKEAVSLPIKHISVYSLTYEKGTPYFAKVISKEIIPLEDGYTAAMYEKAIDFFNNERFLQYEVSNFAKRGYECAHNMNYWENGCYIGVGASAVSYINGKRKKNIVDIEEYIKRVNEGADTAVSTEVLSPLERAKETAALMIRRKKGIIFSEFKKTAGFSFFDIGLIFSDLENMENEGLITIVREKNFPISISLTRKGFLFADTVSGYFL